MNTLTWLDLTAADRDRMRKVLDLFNEQGTVDELGLGTIRDVFADSLFPGTSTIQTRLRYMLFVPWLYQRLERERTPARRVREAARELELSLIKPLLASDDVEGVFGARSARQLKRLPSDAYWGGLNAWGLFVPGKAKSWYHRNFERFGRHSQVARSDDPGLLWAQAKSWHRRLPAAPAEFPWQADLALRRDEAVYLQGAIEARCAGTLLALLVGGDAGAPVDAAFWHQPALAAASPAVRGAVELARRFSLHVEGAPLLYNLMLAEERWKLRPDSDDEARIEAYRAELARWAADEAAGGPFDAEAVWRYAAVNDGTVRPRQRAFVETWGARVAAVAASGAADDAAARLLVRRREMQLKTTRSRFTNQSRLLSWSGRVGVGRMSYRWPRVRQLLLDLHRGLNNSSEAG